MAYAVYGKVNKTSVAIDIMFANADADMWTVVPLIMKALNISESNAVNTYYRWIVDRNFAPGVVVPKRKTSTAVASVPVAKPDLLAEALDVYYDDSVTAEEILADVAAELKADEVEARKAANLEMIKAAAEKMRAAE